MPTKYKDLHTLSINICKDKCMVSYVTQNQCFSTLVHGPTSQNVLDDSLFNIWKKWADLSILIIETFQLNWS